MPYTKLKMSQKNLFVGKNFFSFLIVIYTIKYNFRYCDASCASKEDLQKHVCKYIQCNPKNFICRFCNKELSKLTFSNHVQKDCQYSSLKTSGNIKSHIGRKQKMNESLAEKGDYHTKCHSRKEKLKHKYECDLCGKYLASRQSMRSHMNLHLGKIIKNYLDARKFTLIFL